MERNHSTNRVRMSANNSTRQNIKQRWRWSKSPTQLCESARRGANIAHGARSRGKDGGGLGARDGGSEGGADRNPTNKTAKPNTVCSQVEERPREARLQTASADATGQLMGQHWSVRCEDGSRLRARDGRGEGSTRRRQTCDAMRMSKTHYAHNRSWFGNKIPSTASTETQATPDTTMGTSCASRFNEIEQFRLRRKPEDPIELGTESHKQRAKRRTCVAAVERVGRRRLLRHLATGDAQNQS